MVSFGHETGLKQDVTCLYLKTLNLLTEAITLTVATGIEFSTIMQYSSKIGNDCSIRVFQQNCVYRCMKLSILESLKK